LEQFTNQLRSEIYQQDRPIPKVQTAFGTAAGSLDEFMGYFDQLNGLQCNHVRVQLWVSWG